MLIVGTFEIDPRLVALYAHRRARMYRSPTVTYREAFKWAMREATEFAMGVREIEIRNAATPVAILSLRNEIIYRECQSRISDTDRSQITRLKHKLFEMELIESLAFAKAA